MAGNKSRRRVKPKELLDGGTAHDPIARHMKIQAVKKKLEGRKVH